MSVPNELFNILIKLEDADELNDYFNWTEEEKQTLVNALGKGFVPVIRRGKTHKLALMSSIWRVIKDAESIEDYEVADLMTRCLRILEDDFIR